MKFHKVEICKDLVVYTTSSCGALRFAGTWVPRMVHALYCKYDYLWTHIRWWTSIVLYCQFMMRWLMLILGSKLFYPPRLSMMTGGFVWRPMLCFMGSTWSCWSSQTFSAPRCTIRCTVKICDEWFLSVLIFPAHKLNILKLSIFHCLNPYLSVVGAQISSAGYDYSYDAIPLVLDAADCRLMLPLASYLGFCILLVLSLSVARPWLDHGMRKRKLDFTQQWWGLHWI